MSKAKDCGCGRAGIGIFNDDLHIERCDDCALFDTDADAAEAVGALLDLLGTVYAKQGGTVADALNTLYRAVRVTR